MNKIFALIFVVAILFVASTAQAQWYCYAGDCQNGAVLRQIDNNNRLINSVQFPSLHVEMRKAQFRNEMRREEWNRFEDGYRYYNGMPSRHDRYPYGGGYAQQGYFPQQSGYYQGGYGPGFVDYGYPGYYPQGYGSVPQNGMRTSPWEVGLGAGAVTYGVTGNTRAALAVGGVATLVKSVVDHRSQPKVAIQAPPPQPEVLTGQVDVQSMSGNPPAMYTVNITNRYKSVTLHVTAGDKFQLQPGEMATFSVMPGTTVVVNGFGKINKNGDMGLCRLQAFVVSQPMSLNIGKER